MHNLIQYCLDIGPEKFIKFKFQRKSKYIMREHFVSKKDVSKYDLYLYVNKDQYGRYKMLKYVSRNISCICEILSEGKILGDRKFYYIGTKLYKISEITTDLIDRTIQSIDVNLNKDVKRKNLLDRLNKLKNIEKL